MLALCADMVEAMDPASGLLGRTLENRFVLVDVLGEGAMSVVYRGFELECLTEIAVKVLRPELATDARLLRRFHREATLAERVGHANVVRIWSHGQDGDLHYIVMELCSGRSLGKVLEAEGPLNQARAANLVVQLCGALAVAHQRGLVHRDIKPDNIMVIDAGARLGERVKLVDFGFAREHVRQRCPGGAAQACDEGNDLTVAGSLVGTPFYMAPEQCAGLAQIDARADIYACGVVLFEMVTGQRPFNGVDVLDVCRAHLHGPVPGARSLVPWVVPKLECVIEKALAKAPCDRFQSAEELRVALVDVLDCILEAELDPTQPVSHDDTLRSSLSDPTDPLGLFRILSASDPPTVETAAEPFGRTSIPSPPAPHQNMWLAAMICAFTVAIASACYHWWATAWSTPRASGLRAGETCLQKPA
jgi:serine/threonine protein kinase